MDLDSASHDIDGNAAIATDPMGNAITAWSRTTGQGASEDVWASFYLHSFRVWTGAVKISGGGSASNPCAAIDANGNALVVWEEGFPSQIMFRSLSVSGVWSPDLSMPPSRIHSSKNGQTNPRIGIDASGNAIAIWMEYFGKAEHILSAAKKFGAPWVYLNEISSGLHSASLSGAKPISINESGKTIAVWEEAGSEIHGALYENGAWSQPMAIYAEPGQAGRFPSAGIDAAGNALIVWNEADTIRSKTIIDNVLSKSPLLASNPAYPALHPDVGVDAQGNGVVVFERSNAVHKFISGALLPFQAASWSPPIDISAPSPASAAAAGHPVLSLNAIGDGVVLWKEQGETSMTLQGAGYALGTWSLSKTLSSLSDASGTLLPTYAVSVNLTGNIMAVWPEVPPTIAAAPTIAEAAPQITEIKAITGVGLANLAPLPPVIDPVSLQVDIIGVASGVQVAHKFPAHTDLINRLTWESPGEISHYNIYRGGFSTLIGTSVVPRYEDHQRPPKKKETYLITSVDRNGQESSPTTLIVHPRH